MEFYHLVTRKPMTIGQHITFEKEDRNRLYSFFLDNHFKYNDKQSAAEIWQAFRENGHSISSTKLSFLSNVQEHESRAIREVITEMVRLEYFPMYPSRFKCLYGTTELKDLYQWKEVFESFDREVLQIVKLESEGPYFQGDAELLPSSRNVTFVEKMEQAKKYWRHPNRQGVSEVLIGGVIEVVDILEDFQTTLLN